MMQSRRFPDTNLYCITASQYSLGRSNLEIVRQILEAGIRIIQYREKDFPMRQKYQECLAIRDLTARYMLALLSMTMFTSLWRLNRTEFMWDRMTFR